MSDKKILIRVYGDSLLYPRESEGLGYGDLYQELLTDQIRAKWPEKKVTLITRSMPGYSISNIYKEAYSRDSICFNKESTDITIIHCGICDCAPRPISIPVKKIIGRLPPKLRESCIRFLHQNRAKILNSGRVWRLTKPELFSEIITTWIKQAATEARFVYVINIAPTLAETNTHSPGLGESISFYNTLIKKAVDEVNLNNLRLIDVYNSIRSEPDGLENFINHSDGHHLTKQGHAFYAAKLLELSIKDLESLN